MSFDFYRFKELFNIQMPIKKKQRRNNALNLEKESRRTSLAEMELSLLIETSNEQHK